MRRLLIIAALCACDEPKPRVFSDEDIARYEARLMKRIEENRQRKCVRPLLRGTPIDGNASKDMLAISEPSGEMAACSKKLRIDWNKSPQVTLRDLAERRDPRLMAVETECGARFEAALTRAVSHEDACSPYQAGVHAKRDELSSLEGMRFGALLGLRARLRAEGGYPADAVALLLDVARFGQDSGRGRVAIIFSMVGTVVIEQAAHDLEAILSNARLGPDEVTSLATALDTLIASQEGYGHDLRADRDHAALHLGLVYLKPPTWPVPGGRESPAPPPDLMDSQNPQWRDNAAFMLATVDIADDLCAIEASLAQCWRDLNTNTQEVPSLYDFENAIPLALSELPGKDSPAKHEHARRLAQRRLLADRFGVSAFAHYVVREVISLSGLVGARIALEVKRQGRCPTAAELASPYWLALRSPAALGDAVQATLENGLLQIRPPAWAKPPPSKRPYDPTFSIPCP